MSWADVMAQPPDPPPQLRDGIPLVGVTVLAGSPRWARAYGRARSPSVRAARRCWSSRRARSRASPTGCATRPARWASRTPPLSVLHRRRVRLDNAGSVKHLREVVRELRPALVVLDPLNRLHGADETGRRK